MSMTQHPADAGEWFAEVPRSVRRHTIVGLVILVLSFGGFGAWAFRAPLAAAVIAQGSFVATGQNKIVQHFEGGIIKEILVSEGDRVEAGQLLLKLDGTQAAATERELYLRQIRLEATQARLMAEEERRGELRFSPALEAAREDLAVADILEGQELSFRVSRDALENDLALLERSLQALEIRARGYQTQLETHRGQLALLLAEHADKVTLFERGLLRRPELLAIERAQLEAEGQIGRLEAEIAEIEEVVLKHRAQIAQEIDRYREKALDELQGVQAELESIREKSRTARSIHERVDLVAPVAGTVVRLYFHTPGGVIESGRPILEILPVDEPLIIEVQIPRVEIDSVRRGQPATVRLTALNQRTTPVLDGEVYYVSADAITDGSGDEMREVYLARISLDAQQLGRVPNFSPTPGMPTEIMIQTASRTFVQYIAKPIKDSMTRAFREN
ncbi:HlyD family type I secretion periplasmic adaptor subunit [Limimaricola sp. G21655-S1]|uniref:HlyD family type I secretion periplasmic adaptor subunit n=1 Tax=unclassified Limimaricola TaxID=2626459 RepID=UPI0022B068AB|nr:HlyD family type I secretion periplasmic adaptor subunit [Limimaricola sp. G21655-S1]MCZ4260101.1 HlyD family type I secretion periplasmic adaptor subunit [Limimaricola sp. G21655-S1]